MKKNILTVIIAALIGLNVVLTTLIVFVMVPSMSKVNNLVSDVASIIDLDLQKDQENGKNVSIEDTDVYNLESSIKANCKKAAGDDASHYAAVESVSITLNKKADDYSKLNEMLESRKNYIIEIITDALSSRTMDEANGNRDAIKEEILEKLQKEFNTKCIIGVSMGSLVFQ